MQRWGRSEDPVGLAAYRRNFRLAVAPAKPAAEEALSAYDDFLQDIIESPDYTN